MLNFLERGNFLPELRSFVAAKPTFGTCAGAILLAKEVLNLEEQYRQLTKS